MAYLINEIRNFFQGNRLMWNTLSKPLKLGVLVLWASSGAIAYLPGSVEHLSNPKPGLEMMVTNSFKTNYPCPIKQKPYNINNVVMYQKDISQY